MAIRWTTLHAMLRRAKYKGKCADCRGLPWTCRCKRTGTEIAMWMQHIATALQRQDVADYDNAVASKRKKKG